MVKSIPILDNIPGVTEFYSEYWNKKPFLIRNGIGQETLSNLISADELAGLSLEEDIRSRIVTKGKSDTDWKCEHGPFDETLYQSIGDKDWSLLVQDVDQYHPGTTKLLSAVNFSPKWLIDDIMVSYSVPGGGVGPHLDSYHVFLVQGMGQRRWKIGFEKDRTQSFIQGLDLKILENDFDGEEFVVDTGDILYIPPLFPHSGETLSEALTFSIGFLGPSLSELLIEFGHFIEEHEEINNRYDGNELDSSSAGDDMAKKEVDNFRNTLSDAIRSKCFENWLRDYFSSSD